MTEAAIKKDGGFVAGTDVLKLQQCAFSSESRFHTQVADSGWAAKRHLTFLSGAFLLCLSFLPLLSSAQSSDFQLRAGVEVKQDFRKGFDLSVNYQARFDKGVQHFRGSYFSADMGYKLSDHFNALLEFRYATSRDWDKFRYGIGLVGKTKVGKIDLSAKLRYQYENFLQSLPEIGQYPSRQNIRLKLQVERKVVKHVRGHISAEPQVRIAEMQANFQRIRNIVGLDWEIVKNHHLDVSYYYQPEFKGSRIKSVNMLVGTFSLDLPKWKKKKDKEKDSGN
jgi:hypothetical protein